MTNTRPSLRSANWLYLVTMLLILTLGSYLQSRSFAWGLLLTEFGLILVPTLLWLRLGRLAPRATLRLRWPGGRLVLLGALIGGGTWGLGIALQGLASTVLGYTPPSGLLPASLLDLTIFVLALAVAAPLCEEALFRGYLLSAYGRYAPSLALLAVGLLFAFYHLQFSGLVALLPIALVLGLLAHRANSLAPAIAAHFANNSLAAIVAVATTLNPALAAGQTMTILLCGVMLIGPVVALAALWAYVRLTRPPVPAAPLPAATPSQPEPAAAPPAGRGAFLPLAGAALIYFVVAGLELVMGRFPQVLASRALDLEPAPFAQPLRLSYTLWNVLDEPVGDVACAFTPQPGAVAFECLSRQRAFEVQLGSSYYAGGQYELRQSGRWDSATMRLLEAQLDFDGEFSGWSARVAPAASGLSLALNGAAPVPLPADAVLMAEWPFRFMALPLDRPAYFGSRFNQVLLNIGAETGTLTQDVVLLRGEEALPALPGGPARAWKVQVGKQTAWYAVEAPHVLLSYSDGFGVTWTLDPSPTADLGD